MSTVPSAGCARTRVREVIAALVVIDEPVSDWVTQIVRPLFAAVSAVARASRVATDTSHEPGCGVGVGVGDGVGVGVGDGVGVGVGDGVGVGVGDGVGVGVGVGVGRGLHSEAAVDRRLLAPGCPSP